MRAWRLLQTLLALWVMLGTASAQTSPKTPAFAPNVVHTETMQVGAQRLSVQFTSAWPPRAQKSFDLIFAPEHGTGNLTGSWKLLGPDGSEVDSGDSLPHYPRDRRYWGLDSVGFTAPGLNTFVVTIGKSTGTLAVQVGPPPAGPPRLLISVLALLPVFGVLLLAVRAWRRSTPLRRLNSKAW
ncbi:hypothetical protein Q0M94_18405 (plasmid) [Deinococcus radiomollis]|uniref:hypothetical protein n=1 Tax=Deinococcus radiomollis TaxID=468916 RepID=UPI003891DBCA